MKKRIAIAALAVAGMASSALALAPEAQDGRDVPSAALTVAIGYAPNAPLGGRHATFDSVWAAVYDTGAVLAGYDVGWIITA